MFVHDSSDTQPPRPYRTLLLRCCLVAVCVVAIPAVMQRTARASSPSASASPLSCSRSFLYWTQTTIVPGNSQGWVMGTLNYCSATWNNGDTHNDLNFSHVTSCDDSVVWVGHCTGVIFAIDSTDWFSPGQTYVSPAGNNWADGAINNLSNSTPGY